MPSSDPSSSSSSPDAWDISEDLVSAPSYKAAATNTLHLDGLLTPPLVVHEDLTHGNGGQLWPAGMILAKYLLRKRRDELQDATIVELGSGGGLVGLAIGVGCIPKLVHITDQQPMLDLMQRNIALNGLEDRVKASVYDWGNERPEAIPHSPDMVLAADCVYFEPAFPLLHQTLQHLIGPETVCYFCFKRRRRADMHFLKSIRKTFVVEEVTDDPDRESYARENIYLLTIRQKPQR
ncbi:Hypothetical predicted protein [Lecanosticta acicola]|uniref:Protein-lysine N-methyltransferase EFM6 n=1 Tax=Lecanosticta acicola TaxID=111012 RepID=A0AAI8Z889_9PEZI|nr:Hypothetical predicted protein [Lecanosticta acicola]